MFFMLTAYATEGQAAAGAAGGMGMIIYLVVMVAIFYFLLIRPQKKRQKAMQNMLDAMQVNDKVVTAGGIMGKVVSIKEDSVVIETGVGQEKSKIKFEKSAISKVLTIHE